MKDKETTTVLKKSMLFSTNEMVHKASCSIGASNGRKSSKDI